MKIAMRLLFLALVSVLSISVAAADEKGQGASIPGPNVVSQAKYPVSVAGGDYELLTIVLEFPPGAGMENHTHGGNVLVTVLSGEITLREKGMEKVLKTGESWTEAPGNVHSVVNAGPAAVRVVAAFLLPKGAEATTMAK